jgi:simple sugar transport system permease protein
MQQIAKIILSASFGYAVIRVTTPILFASLSSLISNKAGATNIGIEGMMLSSALIGVIVSAFTQSAWIGLLAAVITGMLLGLVLAYFSLNLKTDIVLAGIALNLLASGGTVFLLYVVAHDKGASSSLSSKVMPLIDIPILSNIPVIGDVISGHNVLTYLSIIAVIFIYFLLYKTPIGLRIRAVGENKDAADSVGINVIKVQYIALAISGIMAGLGGAFMSMGYVSWFSTDMIAGRGFIALAANALGREEPMGVLITSLLFGFADALSNSIQTINIPSEFIQMIPYLTTIIGLFLYSIRMTKEIKDNKIQKFNN